MTKITQAEFDKRLELHRLWRDGLGLGVRLVIRDSDFTGLSTSNNVLRNCVFTGCDFTGSDFTGCDLRYSDFTGSDFTGCDFTGSALRYSDFTGSDFTGSDLTGVILPTGIDI